VANSNVPFGVNSFTMPGRSGMQNVLDALLKGGINYLAR
jgi:hypothetical protein